jgi:hypothetical protein
MFPYHLTPAPMGRRKSPQDKKRDSRAQAPALGHDSPMSSPEWAKENGELPRGWESAPLGERWKVDIARVNFGLEDTRSLSIPFPHSPKQRRILAEVERRLSVVEELETVVSAKRSSFDALIAGLETKLNAIAASKL